MIDYQYNNLNQLIQKSIKKDVTTFAYDKRGNRLAENGKKASQSFVYDATNHLVKGTNWKGETSEYTYNALFVRVNQSQTNNGNKTYARDYVIDYTSYERNDLAVFSPGYMEQKHLYTAWGERTEQFTERGNWDRLLYVHEDVMGNTRYYTKATGMTFAELQYDVWGAIASPNKLENNDNGNFVAANFTGHIYDTVLDIYFAEARFYDAKSRQWMSSDPIKDGLNWYQYVGANPTTYFDPNGLYGARADGEDDEDDEDDGYTTPSSAAGYNPPSYKPSNRPAGPIATTIDKITTGLGEGLGTSIGDAVGGIVNTVQHPIQTGLNIWDSIYHLDRTIDNTIDFASTWWNQEIINGDIESRSHAVGYISGEILMIWGGAKAATAVKGYFPQIQCTKGNVAGKIDDVATIGAIKYGDETLDIVKKIEKINENYFAPKEVIDKLGKIEAKGIDFNSLSKKIMATRNSTEGGLSIVAKYSDASGTQFIVHEVTDAFGNILHRDFDAVRIQSGQLINKLSK